MTRVADIAARLRAWTYEMDWDRELAWEAADELERLESERQKYLDALNAIRTTPTRRRMQAHTADSGGLPDSLVGRLGDDE